MVDYSKSKYALGIDLQTTKSHPFGKGAFSGKETPTQLVAKAHRHIKKYRKIAAKAQAIANVENNSIARATAELARMKAHKAKEYKEDRMRAR